MSIKSFNLNQKHNLIYSIERNLNNQLYPEMCEKLKAVINLNTVTSLGFEDNRMSLITKGVVYDPQVIRPLAHLLKASLPLHKSCAKEFSEVLNEYRKDINTFASFRNMLIKAVAIADNLYDIAQLTTIPLSSITTNPDETPKVLSRGMTEEVIQEFKTKHTKSIELVEYYATYTQLFGDISRKEEE